MIKNYTTVTVGTFGKIVKLKHFFVRNHVHRFELNNLKYILCLFMMQFCFTAYAKMTTTNVDVNITGTVVATASCTFNNRKPINIDYGDVYISDINAGGYIKEIPYSLTCKGDSDGKSIQMRIVGSTASFDKSLLATNVTGLGIKLLKNKMQFTPNTWFKIFPSSPPLLEAILVKGSNAVLSNGKRFNASATLVVDYR